MANELEHHLRSMCEIYQHLTKKHAHNTGALLCYFQGFTASTLLPPWRHVLITKGIYLEVGLEDTNNYIGASDSFNLNDCCTL